MAGAHRGNCWRALLSLPLSRQGSVRRVVSRSWWKRGCTVRSVRREARCLEIEFERGIGLAIFNSCSLRGLGDGEVEELGGAAVRSVSETKDSARIVFSGERSIDIDLRDEAFRGPEAMQLTIPGEPLVVWN